MRRAWWGAVLLLCLGCRGRPAPPPATSQSDPVAHARLLLPLVAARPATPPAAIDPVRSTAPPPTEAPTRASCTEPGQVTTATLASRYAGALPYRLYLPPCYGQDGHVYPTLYLLPGNIHDEAIWDDLGLDETATAGILQGALPPMLVVMPAGGWLANNSSGGPGSYESVIMEELIPAVEATTCAWPAAPGRAIGGLSRGGYWALEIAFRYPAAFASAGGHSAALVDSYAWPAVDPRFTGLSHDLGRLRIYLDIGESDYLREPLRQLHLDLEEKGVPHTWVLNAGQHEEAYWAAQLGAYLAWYAEPWDVVRRELGSCLRENN